MLPEEVNKTFGNIDLFLLDQLLKGRIKNSGPLLDAGCGEGRNIKYFVSAGYRVFGIDNYPEAIKAAQMIYKDKAFFETAAIEDQPFPDSSFDNILCINVLHHSDNEEHFRRIFHSLCTMLKSKGTLFIRTFLKEGSKHHYDEKLLHYSQYQFMELVSSQKLVWQEPLKKEVLEDGKALAVIVVEKG